MFLWTWHFLNVYFLWRHITSRIISVCSVEVACPRYLGIRLEWVKTTLGECHVLVQSIQQIQWWISGGLASKVEDWPPLTEVPTLPIFAEDFRFLCLVFAITIPINNLPIFAWTTLYRPNIKCCNTILIPLCVFRGKNGGNDGGITAVFSDIDTAFFILLIPNRSC